MPTHPTSRPAMLGDLWPPAPQAAIPTRGHEPPDPHGTNRPATLGDLRPPARQGCPNVPGGRRPLPDPAAVRLCLIPDPAPPYDGAAERAPGAGARPQEDRAPGEWEDGGREAGDAGWPSRFAQVLAETLAGSRPPGQMVPWTTEMARAHIGRLGPQLASGQQPRVRRVVTFRPARDVMEMTVVVGFGPRVRALAVRLERSGGTARETQPPRWLCTAVEAA